MCHLDFSAALGMSKWLFWTIFGDFRVCFGNNSAGIFPNRDFNNFIEGGRRVSISFWIWGKLLKNFTVARLYKPRNLLISIPHHNLKVITGVWKGKVEPWQDKLIAVPRSFGGLLPCETIFWIKWHKIQTVRHRIIWFAALDPECRENQLEHDEIDRKCWLWLQKTKNYILKGKIWMKH